MAFLAVKLDVPAASIELVGFHHRHKRFRFPVVPTEALVEWFTALVGSGRG
jgi:hypothetical protein